jgi:hypothetical protein
VSNKDSSDLVRGPIGVVVDDHGVEPVGGGFLDVGPGEAPLDGGGVVLAALEEPAPLLVPRRGLHEHQHRVWVRRFHRQRALDVHLEQHVVPAGQVLLDRLTRRAVQVAVDVEPLEEPAGVADALELGAVDEDIVRAVDLTGTTWARRRRDRQPQPRVARSELPDDGPLADPGRARDDEQDAQGVPPISRSASAALRAGCGRARAGAGSR